MCKVSKNDPSLINVIMILGVNICQYWYERQTQKVSTQKGSICSDWELDYLCVFSQSLVIATDECWWLDLSEVFHSEFE